jgi:hypothetical protein
MFLVPCVTLVLVTLLVALLSQRRESSGGGYVWALAGLLVTAACWAAPLVQEFTTHPGNMTLLLRDQRGGKRAGFSFGMKMLSAATMPRTLWWRSLRGLSAPAVVRAIDSRSVLSGEVAVFFLILPLAIAWRVRSRPLATLSGVTIIASASLVLTFMNTPSSEMGKLVWLVIAIFPVGALSWLSLATAAFVLTRHLLRRWRPSDPELSHLAVARGLIWLAPLPLALLLALSLSQVSAALPTAFSWPLIPAVSSAARQIEAAIPPEPVRLATNRNAEAYPLITGIAMQLQAAGYRPEVTTRMLTSAVGPGYAYTSNTPLVDVTVHRVDGHIQATLSWQDVHR